MNYENLSVTTKDGIAVVIIDRPEKLNALNDRTLDELEAAFRAIGTDRDVAGVILTGAGTKAFVAGADIAELSRQSPIDGKDRARRGQQVFARVEQLGKPVIGAINGFALGGGCELALACHLRVAAEGARFGTPEVKLGLMCGYAGTQRLPRLVGRGRALEMLLTGEMIGAEEAHRIGLVNKVVPADELMDSCLELMKKILANGPIALRMTLDAVNRGSEMPLAEAQYLEASLFGLLCTTEDMKEGTAAFLDKRPAKFEGR